MNGNGSEMTYSFFACPLAYMNMQFGEKRDKDLVIEYITKNKVVYALRSQETNRIGIVRHTKLFNDKKGSYFMFRGQKIFLRKGRRVL